MRFISALAVYIALSAASATAMQWKQNPPAGVTAGDIVFRRGHGIWTRFFVNASTREKRFSHVGVAATNGAGRIMIIHSEANDLGLGRVKEGSWQSFFEGASEAAVYRCTDGGVDPADVVAEARRRIGVRFDNEFDAATTNKLYCSELVMVAVNAAAGRNLIKPTFRSGKTIVGLDDIYREGFEKIYDSKKSAR